MSNEEWQYWDEQYFPMIKKLVFDMTNSVDQAEDIFYEALTILFENINKKKIKLTTKLSTYVYGIAENKCNEFIRENQRMRKIPIDNNIDTDEIIIEPIIDDELDDDERERMAALKSCIGKLPDTRKKIIIDYYYKKMSMKEIAEKHNFKNADSIKSQKYKAIQDLENCINHSLKQN